MTETERIRWEDKEPGNGDVYNVASIGCAGTAEEAAFIIYTPDELHAGWLLSVRLVPGGLFLYADTPDGLKVKAERWLERFVGSLGAVFPDPKRQGEIADRIDQIIGWAKDGRGDDYYVMDREKVDRMREDIITYAFREAAPATAARED